MNFNPRHMPQLLKSRHMASLCNADYLLVALTGRQLHGASKESSCILQHGSLGRGLMCQLQRCTLSVPWQSMLSSIISWSCTKSTSHEGKQRGQHTCNQRLMVYSHHSFLLMT